MVVAVRGRCGAAAILLGIAAALLPAAAAGQAAPPGESVPVVLDGITLFHLTGSLGDYTPAQRALDVAGRLERAARDESVDPARVAATDVEGTAVMSGDRTLVIVLDEDARAAGLSRQELARRIAAAVQRGLIEYRHRHSVRLTLLRWATDVLAWLAFGLGLWLLRRTYRAVTARLPAWLERRGPRAGPGGPRLLLRPAERLVRAAFLLLGGLFVLGTLPALLAHTLSVFPATRRAAVAALAMVTGVLGAAAAAVVGYLPSLLFLVIVFAATYAVIRSLRFVSTALGRGLLSLPGFHPEWAEPTYRIAAFLLVGFALVVAFPYLPGGDSPALRGVSIFIGVLISLGSGSAMGNAVAGIILTYMRSFRLGDRIQVAGVVGDVAERSALVTRLRTIKNEEVILPNSTVLGSHIVNYSALARREGLILHVTVTIGYDAPWRAVHALLVDAARGTAGILADPPPFVLQTSLNDHHVSYELNAYTDRPTEMHLTYAYLNEAIQDRFNAAGVEIMSPVYSALRDGNTVTIPADQRRPEYQAPAFRVEDVRGARPPADHPGA